MNITQNLKASLSSFGTGLMVGAFLLGATETGITIYDRVTYEQRIHNVSDPDDRAFADDVREKVDLNDWVPDSIIIQLRDFPCDVWDRYPDQTWETMKNNIANIMGEGPAFPYIAHKEVLASCPQYADKFPVDFDYRKG